MKKLLFTIVVGILSYSCVQEPSGKKNVELIDRYVQAVEELDYQTMEDLLADDYLGLGPSYGDSIKKPEAIANLKKNVDDLYESIDYDRSRNLAVTIPDGPEQGEWVSNWAELTIVYWRDKIEQSKIVRSMTFYNEADVLEQLGYVFINPEDL